ncbi:MAG TPA: CopG family transcriptional regulator [Solirubrobacteraceae bacterium]|nr:CopG family transcriptional regulator [Solirubrobacteraceae bacterium]
MQKTSVYLTPEEAELLRSTAAQTGRSRAELIREGVRLVTGNAEPKTRTFHSLGKGHGGGEPYRRWEPEELYRRKVAPGR